MSEGLSKLHPEYSKILIALGGIIAPAPAGVGTALTLEDGATALTLEDGATALVLEDA